MNMNGVTELGYIGLGVANLEEWAEFAQDVLGLEVVHEGDDDRFYIRMDQWHHRFVVHRTSGEESGLYYGWRVSGVEEFHAILRSLDETGVKYKVGDSDDRKERMVLELATLHDPAGNAVEIFHGPRVDPWRPFHSGRRMFGRFVTGLGGLGHCDLWQPDIDLAYQFYSRLLGMRGSVEYILNAPSGEGIVKPIFLHCNSRDHSLALMTGPRQFRMNHIMIEVDNLDDVGFTYDLVKSRKIPVAVDLGKHSNDQMLSFYFQTPSGWVWEYGWGARSATHQSEYYVSDMWGHHLTEAGGGIQLTQTPT